jgi:death on curing protein
LPSEPIWISAEDVIEINAEAVERTGERFLLRDAGLLESAVARPRHRWAYGEEDIISLAVALLLGIALNHPFEQGNKRTAFVAATEFLELNGYQLVPEANRRAFADLIVGAIEKRIGEDKLTARFAEIVRLKQ